MARYTQFCLDTNGASCRIKAISGVYAGGNNRIMSVQGFLGLSAAPSSEITLIVDAVGNKLVGIGTDRKLYFYDKGGTQRGSASTTLIPTAGLQEITIFWDGLTLSTVWISVFFGASEELAFDTGVSYVNFFGNIVNQLDWGEILAAGTNRRAQLFADDLYGNRTTTAGDAPHLVAYPRHRGNGLIATPPDSEGTYTAWGGNTATPNTWQDIDETPNNGDTDSRDTATKSINHTFKSSAANPIPTGGTPVKVQMRCVSRLLGDNKVGAHFMLRLGGNETFTGLNSACGGGTSYGGKVAYVIVRPGGGSWARTDFDPNTLEFGWRSDNLATFETGPRITQQLGPEVVYYTASLGLSTTPVAAVKPPIEVILKPTFFWALVNYLFGVVQLFK